MRARLAGTLLIAVVPKPRSRRGSWLPVLERPRILGPESPPGGAVCASQQGADERRRPAQLPQSHLLSLPIPATPPQSIILLTFHPPPRRTLPGAEPGQQADQAQAHRAQAGESRTADAVNAQDTGSLLDAGLLIIGAVFVLAARATLTRTWLWSWRAGSGAALTLSRMHGICTSTMGELAQGASGMAASRCLWVDGSWTAAVLLAAAGCILAVIGLTRMLRATVKTA